jgi:hypothetical protein
MNSHFTVHIKPIPRGINRDDLVANHLICYGQIKAVRFGEGRGAAGDVMYVDYFDANAALAAVKGLNGTRDPGTSHLVLQVALTKTSLDAVERIKRREMAEKAKAKPIDLGLAKEAASTSTEAPARVRPQGAFKYLRSRDGSHEVCVIDFSLLR